MLVRAIRSAVVLWTLCVSCGSSDAASDGSVRDAGREVDSSPLDAIADGESDGSSCRRSCQGAPCKTGFCEPVRLYSPTSKSEEVVALAAGGGYLFWSDLVYNVRQL